MERFATLICLWAGGRRYLAPGEQIEALGLADPAGLPERDQRGRPITWASLAALLGADQGGPPARHALIVALRRRSVGLLAERVDAFGAAGPVQALGPLAGGPARHWLLGAVADADEALLLLDLRQIAADLARAR